MWWDKIAAVFKTKDLRNKILFVLGLLVVFRAGAAIPIPGVDVDQLKGFFEGNQFFGLLNIFTGGALDNLSILMLGVGPYITASIIMQLLTMIFPALKTMYQEEGEVGRQKFNQYSRYLTVPLAFMQAYGLLLLLERQDVLPQLNLFGLITNMVIVSAGSIFLMWLGELISEKGIGNGISLLIFAGIIASLPTQAGQLVATYDASQIPTYIGFLAAAFFIIAGVVLINEGQRNVPVSYAKRVRGFRMFGGVSTHLPLRVNQAGVIPIIFALSILLFPAMIANFLTLLNVPRLANIAQSISQFFNQGAYYAISYFILVVLFTYFYTAVTFDPKAISENLQKQGAFVPGIRPGQQTAEFMGRIINRITLVGALALGIIAILPFITQGFTGLATLAIGGTSLLIVVSVVLETIKQIEAQLSLREYE
ncbi:preprotein translocase subunit SecY [Candidatus Parcubacteria bacterium]|nr:MAG: preprotein translocase subunit SecY [Candidatus Parcubacteria bacterium]